MESSVLKVLIVSEGLCIYSYSPVSQESSMNIISANTDEQLLSGILSAIQTIGSDLGSEVSSVQFSKALIVYRVMNIKNHNFMIIFITDSSAEEQDTRIRMEYLSQIFVRHHVEYILKASFIEEEVLKSLNEDIDKILTSPRDILDDICTVSFLQALVNQSQSALPIKQLEKILKKHGFVYDKIAKRLITPADIDEKLETEIMQSLEKAIKMLFGKTTWENIYQKAEERFKGQF